MNKIKKYFEKLSIKLSKYSDLIGKAVLFFSILMSTIGFSAQIYKNYIEHTNGISILITALALCVFLFRVPYSIAKKAWYLIPADLCGVIASVILIVQWYLY